MIITRKCQAILPLTPLIVMGDTLDKVSFFKYLGVWITIDYCWSKHVSEICFKAENVIGLIYRQYYQNSNTDTPKQLYIYPQSGHTSSMPLLYGTLTYRKV